MNGDKTGSSAPKLSQRGSTALESAGDFIVFAKSLFKDAYHPRTNPDGFISLGVAENSLQHEELCSYFNSQISLSDVDLTYGTDLSGSTRLCETLANFFNKHFEPKKEVLPEHVVTGAGCSAVIDQLTFYLSDSGDGILIAAPYYTGFNADIYSRNSTKPIPVFVDAKDRFGPSSLEAFEAAFEKCQSEGIAIRAVILCNPNNPIGQCYSREAIIEYARFCQRHNIHLISDEIYALSVFPTNDIPDPTPFISVLSIDLEKEAGCDPGRVHVIYGMSKDFNSNGLRIGTLVSQANEDLLNAVRSTSLLMKVSSAADVLWCRFLNDAEYLPKFVAENKKRLRASYEFVTGWLKFHGIPYIPSNAGHFLMADFSQFLPSHDPKGDPHPKDVHGSAKEKQLFMKLIEHKLYLGTATAFSYPVPGWFRMTFAVRRDYLILGLLRLEKALGLQSWPSLNEGSGAKPKGARVDAELEGSKEEVDEVGEKLQEVSL